MYFSTLISTDIKVSLIFGTHLPLSQGEKTPLVDSNQSCNRMLTDSDDDSDIEQAHYYTMPKHVTGVFPKWVKLSLNSANSGKLINHYLPQTKFAKVMFLHVSVILSTGWGGGWYPSMHHSSHDQTLYKQVSVGDRTAYS